MSLDAIIIREITAKDNVSLAEIIRSVLLEMGMPKIGTAYADKALDRMYETYQAERSKYYVIEENGRILGGAGIAPLENFDGNVCELQKMYFLSEARGRNLGYKMIIRCLDTAKDMGFEQCYLQTMPYMENARKLYYKFGFTPIEKPMGDTGHYACRVWMIKDL